MTYLKLLPALSSKTSRLKTSVCLALMTANLHTPISSATDFSEQMPGRALIEKSIAAAQQSKIQPQGKANPNSQKLGGVLRTLIQKRAAPGVAKQSPLQDTPFIRTKNGNAIQVYISVTGVDDSEIRSLENYGLEVELINVELKKVQGWIDADSLTELSNDANVIKISTPSYGYARVGSALTQGDAILKANQLRARGFSGKGVKVGVVSNGTNNWTAARNSGDLPANLVRYGSCTTRTADPQNCIRASGCDEGTAMAEIIHDIAPDAELAVASVSTSLEFIQRINQLANTFKADVIVDDLGFFGEPYFEDGDLAKAVAALPLRVLYISSAGNSANRHYENNYQNIVSGSFDLHNFGAVAGQASQESTGFIAPAGEGVLTILQWNDQFNTPNADYDLFVQDQLGNLLSLSIGNQASGAEPIEATCSYNSSASDQIHFAFVSRSSGGTKRLEMFFLGSPDVQFNVPQGSIFGHPGVERVIAVGAINAGEPGNNNIAFYSSRGPSRVDFPSLKNRPKPDVVGIDGVSVTGAGGFPSTFFGTSASAPHVAGIAAQLMSSKSVVSANNIIKALTKTAVDLGASGHDSIYGFGRVDAVLAEEALIGGNPVPVLLLLLLDEEDQ